MRRERLSRRISGGYGNPDEPLAGYAGLMGLFVLSGVLAVAGLRDRREHACRVGGRELLLIAAATQKASRLLAKDRVTSPLRAPFTQYERACGFGEIEETARGEGMQKAMGNLLTCPYCLAPWVAAAFSTIFVIRPRRAQLLTSVFTAIAIADFLQLAYGRMQRALSD